MTPLHKKLQLKDSRRVLLLNAPPDYRQSFEPLAPGVELHEDADGVFDFVQLFVANREELERRLPETIAATAPDQLLWISYRKGGVQAGTDLNRDILWNSMAAHGFTGVSLVSIDDVWSAMRFKPSNQVKSTRAYAAT